MTTYNTLDFIRSQGTIELSWHEETRSIKIIAIGLGIRATRLCDTWIPHNMPLDPRAMLMRDIEMCVNALLDARRSNDEDSK